MNAISFFLSFSLIKRSVVKSIECWRCRVKNLVHRRIANLILKRGCLVARALGKLRLCSFLFFPSFYFFMTSFVSLGLLLIFIFIFIIIISLRFYSNQFIRISLRRFRNLPPFNPLRCLSSFHLLYHSLLVTRFQVVRIALITKLAVSEFGFVERMESRNSLTP